MQEEPIDHFENPYQSSVVQDDVVHAEYGDSANDLSETARILHQTRPWVLLVATFGVLMMVLFIFGMIVSRFASRGGTGLPGAAELMIFILFGLLPAIPLVLMFRYAQRISRFVAQPNMEHLVSTLETLRTFWRFMGGAALAVIALYVLLFIASVSWQVMR